MNRPSIYSTVTVYVVNNYVGYVFPMLNLISSSRIMRSVGLFVSIDKESWYIMYCRHWYVHVYHIKVVLVRECNLCVHETRQNT